MAVHDGNGWVECRCGRRHWGRHGAAGLLLLTGSVPSGSDSHPADQEPGPAGESGLRVLLQLRAGWVHQGGSWALPGGARDSHEDAVTAALREAAEEVGSRAEDLTVLVEHRGLDHGDWGYTYVVAHTDRPGHVHRSSAESEELRWVELPQVATYDLHPALQVAWPGLARAAVRAIRFTAGPRR